MQPCFRLMWAGPGGYEGYIRGDVKSYIVCVFAGTNKLTQFMFGV